MKIIGKQHQTIKTALCLKLKYLMLSVICLPKTSPHWAANQKLSGLLTELLQPKVKKCPSIRMPRESLRRPHPIVPNSAIGMGEPGWRDRPGITGHVQDAPRRPPPMPASKGAQWPLSQDAQAAHGPNTPGEAAKSVSARALENPVSEVQWYTAAVSSFWKPDRFIFQPSPLWKPNTKY